MKTFRLISIILLLSGQLLVAAGIPELVKALHGNDYAARQTSLNALESRIAQLSNPSADATQRTALERELLGYVVAAEIPELSRAYLIRLLPPIATEPTLDAMFQLVMNPSTSRMLGNDAVGLIAVLIGNVDPEKALKNIIAASEPARELFWAALALRADDRFAKPLLKVLQNNKLPLNDLAIQVIGSMGGRDVASYLLKEWKQAEGLRRTAIARAIVHTGAADTEELEQLCLMSEAEEIRAAALRQWASKNENAALSFLNAQFDKGAADSTALIAIQLTSGASASWEWITKKGSALSESALITVIQIIREQKRKEHEAWVLERLSGGSEPVELAAINCLATVGGNQSIDALFARLQPGTGKIPTAVINTLSVLKDNSIDTRLQAIASDPDHPQYLVAYDLISKRNNPGCVDYFNKLFLDRSPVGKELAAILRALESLGNINSVKLLLARLQSEQDSSTIRTLQVAIKRVVLRLEQPNQIWKDAFAPIFGNSPSVELQSRVLPMLDVVSTSEALAICLERIAGADEVLARAAEQALIRWRNIEVCDHWIAVINDPSKPEATRDQAVRYIDLTLRSDAQADIPKIVVAKASKLFLATENKNLREKLIQMIDGMENHRKAAFHSALSPHFKNLPDHREQIEALIKKGPR